MPTKRESARSKGELITCAIMMASSIVEMVTYYKPKEFKAVLNAAMEAAFYDGALVEYENGCFASFILPKS